MAPVSQILFDDARHLVCVPYTRANLHRVAEWLGIRRCWFHGGRWPHYDIPKRRMHDALALDFALDVDAAMLDEDEYRPVRIDRVSTRALFEAIR